MVFATAAVCHGGGVLSWRRGRGRSEGGPDGGGVDRLLRNGVDRPLHLLLLIDHILGPKGRGAGSGRRRIPGGGVRRDGEWPRGVHLAGFGLERDGGGDNGRVGGGGVRARLCVSKPGLIEQVARKASQTLKKQPSLSGESISPNDVSTTTHCLCDR